MLAQEIRIRGEPTADPQKCRFVLDSEVLSRVSVSFTSESDTENAPLAKRLLDLPYIAGVNISGQVVTLTGDNIESWPAVGKEIGGVIREQIKSGEPAVTEEVMSAGNSVLFDQVNELIKNDVNPSIASHGGIITLHSVKDGKAYVTMGGGCQGCSASSVTLKQGVESYIVAKIDEINGNQKLSKLKNENYKKYFLKKDNNLFLKKNVIEISENILIPKNNNIIIKSGEKIFT